MSIQNRLELAKKNKEFLESILNNDKAVRRNPRMKKRLEDSIRDATEVINVIQKQIERHY